MNKSKLCYQTGFDLPYEIYGIILGHLSLKDLSRHRLVNHHANQSVKIYCNQINLSSLESFMNSFWMDEIFDQIKIIEFIKRNNYDSIDLVKIRRLCTYYLIHIGGFDVKKINQKDYHLGAYLLHHYNLLKAINPDFSIFDNKKLYFNDKLIAATTNPIIWREYRCQNIKPFVKKAIEAENPELVQALIMTTVRETFDLERMFLKYCFLMNKIEFFEKNNWFDWKKYFYFQVRKDPISLLITLLNYAIKNHTIFSILYPGDEAETVLYVSPATAKKILSFFSGEPVELSATPLLDHLAIMAGRTEYLSGKKPTRNLLETVLYYRKYELMSHLFWDTSNSTISQLIKQINNSKIESRLMEYNMPPLLNLIKRDILIRQTRSAWNNNTIGMTKKMKRKILTEIGISSLPFTIMEKEILDVKISKDPFTDQIMFHLDIPGFKI